MENIPWEKLEKVFETVAELIKKGGVHFWPLIVRQQYIEASFWMLGAIGLILVGWGIIKYCLGRAREDEYNSGEYHFCVIGVTIILAIVIPLLLFSAVSLFLNPEWWALKTLIGLVK